MPKVLVSMRPTQQRALAREIHLAGHELIASEIGNAIDQYLAGPKQVEATYLKEPKENAPKNLPPLSTIEKKLNKTTRSIDRSLARLKASERRLAAPSPYRYLCHRTPGVGGVRLGRQGLCLVSTTQPSIEPADLIQLADHGVWIHACRKDHEADGPSYLIDVEQCPELG